MAHKLRAQTTVPLLHGWNVSLSGAADIRGARATALTQLGRRATSSFSCCVCLAVEVLRVSRQQQRRPVQSSIGRLGRRTAGVLRFGALQQWRQPPFSPQSPAKVRLVRSKLWPSNTSVASASLPALGTRCWLTNRSTGRYTACLALAHYFILGQTQSCRSAPVSSNVRHRRVAVPVIRRSEYSCALRVASRWLAASFSRWRSLIYLFSLFAPSYRGIGRGVNSAVRCAL